MTTDIHAIFDSTFSGETSDAVWIIDTPANRIWFEKAQTYLAPDSALFLVERYSSTEEALCHMIWGMIEHFPDWQHITVCGLAPGFPIPNALSYEGRWEIGKDGWAMHRI